MLNFHLNLMSSAGLQEPEAGRWKRAAQEKGQG